MKAVTWVEMAVNSSHQVSDFIPSLAKSVAGEKRCARCCELEQQSQSDNEQRSLQWETKTVNAVIPEESRLPALFMAEHSYQYEVSSAFARFESPELPPPRQV